MTLRVCDFKIKIFIICNYARVVIWLCLALSLMASEICPQQEARLVIQGFTVLPFYRLLSYGIHSKIYEAVKSLYQNTMCCIKVNTHLTPWFETTTGVKQGDNLSPTIFSLFLNDLAIEIKKLNLGIPIDNRNVSILLYADDLVLLAQNENDLQKILIPFKNGAKNGA